MQFRPAANPNGRGKPGRLAPYRYRVGSGTAGKPDAILGVGDSWAAAFEDARVQVVISLEED